MIGVGKAEWVEGSIVAPNRLGWEVRESGGKDGKHILVNDKILYGR
jgi:hypothetical protein